jgi:hypothetical protein
MPGSLRCIKAGDALVVHREDAGVPELEAFAAALAPDPAHVVVVLGRGADYPGDEWAPLLPILAAAGRDVQLIPGDASVTTSVQLGQWLANELGQAVLAHDGAALRASRGALFVPTAHGPGWMRLSPGQEPSSGSRRYPSPGWSCGILERACVLTEAVVAEPLPGGAWIRPRTEANADQHRQQLISRLAWRDDHAYLVLGCPDAPPVAAADAEGLWRLLPPGIRAAVRFVSYGAVAVPDGQPLGQALADCFGERVTTCTGVPWSGQAASDDGDAPPPALLVPGLPQPPPALATPPAIRLEPGPVGEAAMPSRRMPHRMRWPAAAVLACLVIALPVSFWALRRPASPTRVLGASRSSLSPAIRTLTPTVPPTPSAMSDKPTRRIAPTPDHSGPGLAAQAPRPTQVYVAPTRPSPSSPPPTPSPARSTSGRSSGRGSPTPTPAPAPTPTNTCASAWYKATAYVSGDKASYNGDNWTANQWNYDEVPGGASGAWNNDGPC